MTTFVVDASVACKWYLDERWSEAARRLLRDDVLLAVPRFFLIETCNAMAKRQRRREITSDDVRAIADSLERLPLNLWPDGILLREALDLALLQRLSVYDGLYLALAERIGGRLVTADERLVRGVAGTALAARVLPVGALEPPP